MTKKHSSSFSEEYRAQAQELLADWQKNLHDYWHNPEILNQWLATFRPSATPQKDRKTARHAHASVRSHTNDAHGADDAVHAELAQLKLEHARLQRRYATLRKRYEQLVANNADDANGAQHRTKPKSVRNRTQSRGNIRSKQSRRRGK